MHAAVIGALDPEIGRTVARWRVTFIPFGERFGRRYEHKHWQ